MTQKEIEKITPIGAWILAFRPKTLPAAIAPVIVGTALALSDKGFSFFPALAALACSLLLQIGVNLANDYFDFIKGIDTGERLGPIRVTYSGLIRPELVKAAMLSIFTLAALIGTYLVIRGGMPILVIGAASILAALAYSGGPYPLASHGLGDLFVFVFFGLVAVCGTYYVQTLRLTILVVMIAVPVGLLITAILIVNNLRDIETDGKTGKRTLAVILGPKKTNAEFVLLLFLSYSIPVFLWLLDYVSIWALLPLLSLPMAISKTSMILKSSGKILNEALAGTARLMLIFSILLSIGLIIPS